LRRYLQSASRFFRVTIDAVKRWLVLAVVLTSTPAFAGGGTVTINLSQDGQQLATDMGLTPADLAQKAQDAITRMYEVNRVDDFLTAFADATSFSNRGIGVDYASNADGLMLGIAGNIAVATDNAITESQGEQHPVAGVAPNLSIMAGVNLARYGHPKLTLYANGFYRSGSYGPLDGSITSIGVHGQYKFFAPTSGLKSLVLKWGGIDVTGGIEASRWSFDATHSIDEQFTVDGTNGTSNVDLSATGTFALSSDAVVLPIEATTSMRFAYFVSVYAGAGIDLQLGKASVNANLDGTMNATDPADGSTKDMGTATITVQGDKGPSVGKLRGLAGVQINVWKLKTFVQVNAMPFTAASVAFGIRFVL
jgi:hypothetical protein